MKEGLEWEITELASPGVNLDFQNPTLEDTFCILPWKHLEVRREGLVDFCCKYDYPLVDENGAPLYVHYHSLDQIWNSDDIRTVRKRMVQGHQVEGCRLCFKGSGQ